MALDLNLLNTLDVLLTEGSVTRAARRLQLSPSAMSRALTRLRIVTGDQLLVRAGRGLVETPLIDRMQQEAPGVLLRFVRKLDKSSEGLRDGTVDLETGVVAGTLGPEVRAQALFMDRYVGAVRGDHPLARTGAGASDYVAWRHVVAWRQGLDLGKVDDGLRSLGLRREIAATVDGFAAALALARGSDLIATVPERHTTGLREGMVTFSLPVATPEFTISLLWHPRQDGDPAHRWLRNCVRSICATPALERARRE